MKRFFFLGDFESDTGPGVANRMIQKGLGNRENIRFSRRKNKILRIAEMVWGISTADCVCFCSYSRSNLFAFRLCKMLHKKTAYIMHGYMERESKIANVDEETLKAVKSYERTVFSASDRLICVSKGFMDYMIQAEPEFSDKFEYIYNAVDLEEVNEDKNRLKKLKSINDMQREYRIVSLGGGMRRKQNLAVCNAINELINEGYNIKYTVIGESENDGDAIRAYGFVEYHEKLPRAEVMSCMKAADLYIQNSSFETFGIAPIEALLCGCSILISRNIGMKTLVKGCDDMIIKDDSELKTMIAEVMKEPNHDRVMACFDLDAIKPEKAAERLYGILESL